MKYIESYDEFIVNEGLGSYIKSFFTTDPKEFKTIYKYFSDKDKQNVINAFMTYQNKKPVYEKVKDITRSVIKRLNFSFNRFTIKKLFLNSNTVLKKLDKLYSHLDYFNFKKQIYNDLDINLMTNKFYVDNNADILKNNFGIDFKKDIGLSFDVNLKDLGIDQQDLTTNVMNLAKDGLLNTMNNDIKNKLGLNPKQTNKNSNNRFRDE